MKRLVHWAFRPLHPVIRLTPLSVLTLCLCVIGAPFIVVWADEAMTGIILASVFGFVMGLVNLALSELYTMHVNRAGKKQTTPPCSPECERDPVQEMAQRLYPDLDQDRLRRAVEEANRSDSIQIDCPGCTSKMGISARGVRYVVYACRPGCGRTLRASEQGSDRFSWFLSAPTEWGENPKEKSSC